MASTPDSDTLVARWVGRQRFADALREQLDAREALIDGRGPQRLILVEHPPTLTIGRRGSRDQVLWTDAQLREAGMEVCETPRGGQLTLHAPGQLVAYPVVRVGKFVRAHVHRLADSTLELLAELGVPPCHYGKEHPGVWLGADEDTPPTDGIPRKIASIGIHVSRGVTVQGLSLNVDVNPRLFGALVSCGLPQVQMSSISDFAEATDMPTLAQRWAEIYARRAGLALDGSVV